MNDDLINKLGSKPWIGLSPMAGYTDSAFRVICRHLGADFVVTELVSADSVAYSKKFPHPNPLPKGEGAVKGNTLIFPSPEGEAVRGSEEPSGSRRGGLKERVRGDSKTYQLMRFKEEERPIFIQLFGAKPENMFKAAKVVAKVLSPDAIDINMGCPAHKVVCSGHGSALMKNPTLAAELVTAAIEGSGLPVTVKTRLGWDDSSNLIEFARAMEAAGASLIAIHGRTYTQGFGGAADWEPIYQVKENLKIPVIGNGDIRSGQDALEKIKNLDGIMIGRAAVGNPWIFSEVKDALTLPLSPAGRVVGDRPCPPKPCCAVRNLMKDGAKDGVRGVFEPKEISWEKKFDLLRLHAKLKYELMGDHGLIEMRKIVIAYTKGLPCAAELRVVATKIESLEDIEDIIKLMGRQLAAEAQSQELRVRSQDNRIK